jgi:rhamnosyltransferase
MPASIADLYATIRAMSANARIASVTVAFNPDPTRLARQLEALRGQVDEAIVVDNASAAPTADLIRALERPAAHGEPAVRVISLADNHGVASGFNHGIEAAARRGCEYVLLLDHDSVPAPGMVQALVAAHREGCLRGPVAAVGPRIRDARDRHEYAFVRLGWALNPRVRCADSSGLVACDFLISSGSLIPMQAYRQVGGFDEALFVDYVDLEWCCRARSMGLALYGACAAQLEHRMGDETRTVLGAVRIHVHPPERLYYMMRNRILLYGRSHMPLKWKLSDVPRGVVKVATALIFVAPRREYLRMALAALRDAARGAGGARLRP